MTPAHALKQARSLHADLLGVDQAAGLRRFSAALPTMEAALQQCLADPEALGVIALFVDEDLPRARRLLIEALQIREDLGDTWGTAASLCCLGQAALSEPVSARKQLEEGLRRFRVVGDQLGVCESLEGLAAADVRIKHYGRAGRLLGAAHQGRQDLGLPLPAPRRAAHDRFCAPVDPADMARGATMTLTQAADHAMD